MGGRAGPQLSVWPHLTQVCDQKAWAKSRLVFKFFLQLGSSTHPLAQHHCMPAGRAFFTCAGERDGARCDFFEWADQAGGMVAATGPGAALASSSDACHKCQQVIKWWRTERCIYWLVAQLIPFLSKQMGHWARDCPQQGLTAGNGWRGGSQPPREGVRDGDRFAAGGAVATGGNAQNSECHKCHKVSNSSALA